MIYCAEVGRGEMELDYRLLWNSHKALKEEIKKILHFICTSLRSGLKRMETSVVIKKYI